MYVYINKNKINYIYICIYIYIYICNAPSVSGRHLMIEANCVMSWTFGIFFQCGEKCKRVAGPRSLPDTSVSGTRDVSTFQPRQTPRRDRLACHELCLSCSPTKFSIKLYFCFATFWNWQISYITE